MGDLIVLMSQKAAGQNVELFVRYASGDIVRMGYFLWIGTHHRFALALENARPLTVCREELNLSAA